MVENSKEYCKEELHERLEFECQCMSCKTVFTLISLKVL